MGGKNFAKSYSIYNMTLRLPIPARLHALISLKMDHLGFLFALQSVAYHHADQCTVYSFTFPQAYPSALKLCTWPIYYYYSTCFMHVTFECNTKLLSVCKYTGRANDLKVSLWVLKGVRGLSERGIYYTSRYPETYLVCLRSSLGISL